MGAQYKVQIKHGAVWRTVGKARSSVTVAFDQFKATVRNGQKGKEFRLVHGKRVVREATAQ